MTVTSDHYDDDFDEDFEDDFEPEEGQGFRLRL